MDIEVPKGWRKGQTIFNFLWWLQTEHGYSPEIGTAGRQADAFHIPDTRIDKLFEEFLATHKP